MNQGFSVGKELLSVGAIRRFMMESVIRLPALSLIDNTLAQETLPNAQVALSTIIASNYQGENTTNLAV